MTQPEWDDDRLDAAFHARFDRPGPPTLVNDVHGRIAGTTPSRLGGIRLRPAWSVAVAAVVVIAVAGTALIGLGGLPRAGGGPPAASDASPSTPILDATPTAQALPGVLLDQLPVIGVQDAIAVRDSGVDDREVAVAGWFRAGPVISCPFTPRVDPLQLGCPDELVWLTRDYEPGSSSQPFDSPAGPGFNPDLDGLDTSWEPSTVEPVDVVLVGHFDDRRAELCPKDEVPTCRDRFVVDGVARVHGVKPPLSMEGETSSGTVWTIADIAPIVANEAPDSPILSMTSVDASAIGSLEPSLWPLMDGLADHHALWIVRVLESERLSTYVVIDGTDAIYEINPANEPILVGGEPPAPGQSGNPASWPPAGARLIALTSEVGAGSSAVRVAVVDQSGRLEKVAEKGAVDPSAMSFEGRFGAYAEPGIQGRVHLSWVGGICDSQITVTVSKAIDSISFDMGPQPDCDSVGIGRELVLDFAGSVEVAAIDVREGTATPTPTPTTSLAYDLECLSFAPDECQRRADQIIAATPTQRVVAVAIVDRCGSYRVTFSDGTSTNADVDCLIGPPGDPSPQASAAS